jgi:hypothetical protein
MTSRFNEEPLNTRKNTRQQGAMIFARRRKKDE